MGCFVRAIICARDIDHQGGRGECPTWGVFLKDLNRYLCKVRKKKPQEHSRHLWFKPRTVRSTSMTEIDIINDKGQ